MFDDKETAKVGTVAGLMLLLLLLPLVVMVVEAVAEAGLCFLPSHFSPTPSSWSAPLPSGLFRLRLEAAAVVDTNTLLADSVHVVGVAPKVNAGLVEIKSPIAALRAGENDGTSTKETKDGGAVFVSINLAPNGNGGAIVPASSSLLVSLLPLRRRRSCSRRKYKQVGTAFTVIFGSVRHRNSKDTWRRRLIPRGC
jgi:hypothetical protein